MPRYPVFDLPERPPFDRPISSFKVEKIANAHLLLPPHTSLPMDHPLHMDKAFCLALHNYYDPMTHNASYLVLLDSDSDSVEGEGNSGEPAVVILVSKMAHRREGERLRWTKEDGSVGEVPIYFGLGAISLFCLG